MFHSICPASSPAVWTFGKRHPLLSLWLLYSACRATLQVRDMGKTFLCWQFEIRPCCEIVSGGRTSTPLGISPGISYTGIQYNVTRIFPTILLLFLCSTVLHPRLCLYINGLFIMRNAGENLQLIFTSSTLFCYCIQAFITAYCFYLPCNDSPLEPLSFLCHGQDPESWFWFLTITAACFW